MEFGIGQFAKGHNSMRRSAYYPGHLVATDLIVFSLCITIQT